jgi:hypothetical protein
MVLRPEGDGRSRGQSRMTRRYGLFVMVLCLEGTVGFSPVLTLGTNRQSDLALIRRYRVAPCWKNTRSAGLEVLNGRQMERPNQARLG